MRIAVVNDTVHPFFKGGAQKRVYEISRRLVKRGHQVHWYGMDYGAVQLDGITLHPVCSAYKMYTNTGKRDIRQAVRFALQLDVREPVDVIDCMNFPYLHCWEAKQSARKQRIPLIVTWFEFWGDYWYEYMGWAGVCGKAIEYLATKLPDRIIADSEKVKRQLITVGVDARCVDVVPDGVDIAGIESTTPTWYRYDVVYVGRMLQHKNVDMLVRTLATMKVTAAIVGTGVSKLPCEQLANELGASDRIHFLGNLPQDQDVYALMKSAKVLVLPSTQEGHPLVIPEAHACGIPVIAIEGVCDEFIHHDHNGYLVPLEVNAMRDAITRAIVRYPAFRTRCHNAAEGYDWESITDCVMGVYEKAIEEAK